MGSSERFNEVLYKPCRGRYSRKYSCRALDEDLIISVVEVKCDVMDHGAILVTDGELELGGEEVDAGVVLPVGHAGT